MDHVGLKGHAKAVWEYVCTLSGYSSEQVWPVRTGQTLLINLFIRKCWYSYVKQVSQSTFIFWQYRFLSLGFYPAAARPVLQERSCKTGISRNIPFRFWMYFICQFVVNCIVLKHVVNIWTCISITLCIFTSRHSSHNKQHSLFANWCLVFMYEWRQIHLPFNSMFKFPIYYLEKPPPI